jgi:hypothetical protein
VYVYRDATAPPARPGATGAKSAARQPAEDDTSYWYDLLAEDPDPQREEARGPFEPLLSSGGEPEPDAAGQDGTEQPSDPAREEGSEPPDQARARKLEQLKDLYLTAEAIGEQNVDKHFDQLLAQQRELISDFFRQSAAARPTVAGKQRPAAPERPETPQRPQTQERPGAPEALGPPGRPEAQQTPEAGRVRAEPPRAW